MLGGGLLLWALCVLTAAVKAGTAPLGDGDTSARTSVYQQGAWALETFIDLEDAQGDVMHAELRRHCAHSVGTTAAHFCTEFTIPDHDCARLVAFLAQTRPLGDCDTASWEKRSDAVPFARLGTMGVTVRREEEGNRTQTIKVAVHQGDMKALDTRADNICERFKLDTSVCGEVRRRMYVKTLALEVANVKASCMEGHEAVDAIVEALDQRTKMLEGKLEEKARAIRRITARAEREKLELERHIRELEAAIRRLRPSNTPRQVTSVVLEAADVTGVVTPTQPQVRAAPIPRRHVSNFSYAQYLEFSRSSTPVIIQGFADVGGSPGVPRWSVEYLNQTCGDVVVTLKKPVANSNTERHSTMMWAGIQTATKAPFRDFMRDFSSSVTSQRAWPTGLADLYLHDASIRTFCPRLLSDFTIPRFFVDDRMQLLSRLPQRDYWPSLFVGGPTTSSALHTDWGHTAAWMGLLTGRKHWAIAKSSARAILDEVVPSDHLPSAKRFNATLIERSPALAELLRDGELFEDVLEPGEVLFIPADCPHQVRNLEKTVAVAANFVDSANFDAFRRGLQDAKDSSSGETHRLYVGLLRDLEKVHAEPQSPSSLPSALSPELKSPSVVEFADLTFTAFKDKYNQP